MIKKILFIIPVLLLSGLLINGITMTQQLKKIDASLEQNIESINQLNHVQASIIEKNQELNQMVSTLNQLDHGLQQTTGKTKQTLSLLTSVVNYNSDSLRLNNEMEKSSLLSNSQIHSVQAALSELTPYMNDLDKLLQQLAVTAGKDQQHLEQILTSTKNLNSKTPGVKLP